MLGGAGKSGSLALAAARRSGASRLIGLVPTAAEAAALEASALADAVVVADARDPIAVAEAVRGAGGPADVTVVCVDVAGCEGGAILATRPKGRILFFSMATSFTAAALTAEGVGRDVETIIGNGYTEGWLETAFGLYRSNAGLAAAFNAL